MSQVASQNRFAYLGNDSDGEEKPVVPVKTAPVRTGGNRRGGPGGSEGAFRDRAAGRERNQGRSTEETPRDGPRGGQGARVRGGRGGRFPRDRDDRHPHKSGTTTGSDKQAAQSWGATEGNAELKDEQAGEAIAESEKKDEQPEEAAAEEPAEPEDKSISYTDYLAQQAEKKAGLESDLNIRAANEGSKLDKKWANAKPLEKDEDVYFAGSGGKKQRERERKVKQTVDFDPRFVEPERTRGGGRGGRGGPRGGRGGERGRGGNFRGGRGGQGASINTSDQSAFPSLGGN
ncbi:hypothetical protein TrVGV298_005311 [Trichoderma virens]|nr:hypothetical protein TrVGV298_005311 [Trichoderma virens]